MKGNGYILKTRHLHIVIDDQSYFALLNLQSMTGKSKTLVIEDIIKEKEKEMKNGYGR
jgi:hypothetical protein